MRFTRVCREVRTAGTALSTRDAQNYRESVAYVRHQSHKTSALDGGGDSVLADGGATGLAAADDFALTASEFPLVCWLTVKMAPDYGNIPTLEDQEKANKEAEKQRKAEEKKQKAEEKLLKKEEQRQRREQERLDREQARRDQEAAAKAAASKYHYDDVALWLSEKYDFTQTDAGEASCTMFSSAVKDTEMAKLAIKNALKGSNARMAVPWRLNSETQAIETGYTVDDHVLVFTIGKSDEGNILLTINEISNEQFELFKQSMNK